MTTPEPEAHVHEPRPRWPSRQMEQVPCNHCGHEVTHGVRNVSRLVRCVNCGLIFVNPRPRFEDIAKQYEETYFHCSEPTFGGYEDYEADRDEILRTFRARLEWLKPQVTVQQPRSLDVGCATGLFLEVAREAGWQAEGLDISAYALGVARKRGFVVHRGTLPGAPLAAASYDIITMWDVIEHVTDPSAVLAECARLLRPGGLLVLSTPDAGSALARIAGGRWLGYRSIDEHLYFFSRKTMGAMLTAAGFEGHKFVPIGKYLTLPRLVERMRFYTRIGALLLGTVDRAVPDLALYINSRDTMMAVAVKA